MKKRLISLFLCVCLLTGVCTQMLTFATETDTYERSLNINLLEGMLKNRPWVIDTLINDDYSTNPHAIVNSIDSEKSLMAKVLSQYCNENDPNYSEAYKIMVDALNVWYNADDYAKDVADGVTEWGADILEFFGAPESAASTLRNCADNAKNMQYDNILQEVLKADYTSSSGKTLKGSNSQLVQLRKIQDGVGMLESFTSASKKLAGVDDGVAHTEAAYINEVLIPASKGYYSVMENIGKLTSGKPNDFEKELLDLSTALGMVVTYDSIVLNGKKAGAISTIAPAYLLDEDTKKIIDINADAAKFVDITIDSLMYVASIQTQKKSVAGVFDRTAEHLANEKTRGLLERYSDLIKDAADGKTENFDLILTSIRNSGYIEKFTKSTISKAVKKVRDRFIPCYSESIFPGALASVTGVIGTATYLADAVTGIKDTCTKTLELKNLNRLTAFFCATYERDLANYRANPTDENAAMVIDDLEFIQRLRLRGENIAYNMSKNQLKTKIGKLLAGSSDDMLEDYYEYEYQMHVDAIMGASVVPFTSESVVVGNGQTLAIYCDEASGGLYANFSDANGDTFDFYSIAELEYRALNGIEIKSGGRVIIMEDAQACLPFVVNDGGTLDVIGEMRMAEYTQNSGQTNLASGKFQMDDLYLDGGAVESAKGGTVECDELHVSGNPTSNVTITCSELLQMAGTLSGNTVYLNGDSSGSGTLDKLFVSGSGKQNLNGSVNVADLAYINTGTAQQDGTFYVSSTVSNSSSKVNKGINTILKPTGHIIGNHYNSGLTVDGISIDRAMTFGGTLRTLNNVTLADVETTGGLTNRSGGNLYLTGETTVHSESVFEGNVYHTGERYYGGGDITVKAENSFNKLITNGRLPQTVSGTLNVRDFTNINSKGIKVNNTINVSGVLDNCFGEISGLGMTLLDGGTFSGEQYNGDVTIKSSCDLPYTISGDAVVSASNKLSHDASVGGNLTVNSGPFELTDCDLSVGGNLTVNSGPFELTDCDLSVGGKMTVLATMKCDSQSLISCQSAFTNSSDATGDYTPLTVNGILVNNGTLNGFDIKAFKELSNKGTVKGGVLYTSNDIMNNGTIDVEELKLDAISISQISGNALNTQKLLLAGEGKLNLATRINVSDTYSNAGTKADENMIIVSSGRVIDEDETYTTLNLTTDLVVDGCTLTVDTLNLSAGLTLKNGAKLVVNRRFKASGNSGTVTIAKDCSLTVKKLASISSYSNVIVDGELVLGGDAALNSCKLSGEGSIFIKGDIFGSSLTVEKPGNVIISGKTPQVISASGANFNNLTISNSSRKGVSFTGSVNCYGEYVIGTSNVTGTVTQK